MKRSKLTLALLMAMTAIGCSSEDGDDSSQSSNSNPSVKTVTYKMDDETSVKEPESGVVTFTTPIRFSGSISQDVTMDYVIEPVDATPGLDFVTESGTITIPSGSRSYDLPFKVMGDELDEPDEQFKITISNASSGEILKDTTLVTIKDSDDDATVSFETDLVTVAEGSGLYLLNVKVTPASEKAVEVPFTLGGLATEGQDYRLITASPLVLESGSDTIQLKLFIESDDIKEGGESIEIQLGTPDNASLGAIPKITLLIPGEVGLNDTGVVSYYNGSTFTDPAPNSSYPGQDAEFGYDAEFGTTVYDGAAGFSWTKLDISGNALASSATNYECIRDNRTGLVWERKHASAALPAVSTDDALRSLFTNDPVDAHPYSSANISYRANNYTYYWYNMDDNTNGGGDGVRGSDNANKPHSKYNVSNICAYPITSNAKYCNTDDYIKHLNSEAFCGFQDWKVPAINELRSIINYRTTTADVGEVEYFDHMAAGTYISATPSANGTGQAWCMNSVNGQAMYCNKHLATYLRAVRGDKQ
ncbi:DUF1566 domain-containing protein [Vibrio sp. SCSIO 43140]|uniref:Lcl C-terminal domain-containing protein n=1 Tax=Vibrio sp. SCSIO 43140 TaxID=2819100 RepID=UPI002075843C|nr:DUF1566 domain-containing protein [Vibrio sp. SCSIO 43140]USD58890.1 DUF1566 domain-containing protein [Vibrio sp. SCSIO 43140]